MEGYVGEVLRVNLENDKVERFILEEKVLRQFIGGTGLGAKFLYDEVAPGTAWNDPGNRLIIAAGPLNATAIGGSGSVSVVTKGPLTDGAGCSQSNGYFGAFLRLCGLNAIIVQGVAENQKYLYVDSESAEIKDADWLKGMDTYNTTDLVKHEHRCREREMAVASIGPAGENLVKFAGVFFDYGHSASHNGSGAVMGSKRLKAIALKRGKNKIPVNDPERVRKISKELIENVKTQSRVMYDYGTLHGIHMNAERTNLPVKNYSTSTWMIPKEQFQKFSGEYIRERFSVRRNACWACQMHHCDIMKISEGPYAGELLEEPEYEQFSAWSSAIGQEDVTAAMKLSKEVDRLGMDTNEAGWVVGFAMECIEKGLVTREKANDLDLSWGNAEGARLLLNLMRVSKKIGGEAENFAIHTLKGNTPRGHDHRNRWTEQFDTCVSNTGTLETWGGPIPLGTTPKWEDIVDTNLHDKGAMVFEDSLVTCRFNTRMNVDLLSQALSAVTGWDFSWDEGMHVGKRIVHLLRAFNTRHGIIGREVDRPSPRYGSTPDAGPGEGKSLQKVWDKMLDKYYKGMGWDSSGKPLPQTLKEYNLDYVARDL